MNYEAMWEMLKAQVEYLQSRGVTEIHPVVLQELMSGIYDTENGRDERAGLLREIAALKGQADVGH